MICGMGRGGYCCGAYSHANVSNVGLGLTNPHRFLMKTTIFVCGYLNVGNVRLPVSWD